MEKPRLQERYEKTVIPALEKELGTANVHAVPRVTKVVLNVGIGQASRDPKLTENVIHTLESITGQKPVVTKARKSISNFKIRQGMGIGVMVTLRGRRMYDFLDKLVNVSFPRVRDFQGLKPTSFDSQGNYTVALKEHNVFPEISADTIEALHGLEVTVCTTAHDPKSAAALLKHLGFPFRQD
mgnify:CR=1 FL=1